MFDILTARPLRVFNFLLQTFADEIQAPEKRVGMNESLEKDECWG